jgi:hypothetical protein
MAARQGPAGLFVTVTRDMSGGTKVPEAARQAPAGLLVTVTRDYLLLLSGNTVMDFYYGVFLSHFALIWWVYFP